MIEVRINAAMFVALNLLDAYLTEVALSWGGVELFPLMRVLEGQNLFLYKGCLAIGIVGVLFLIKRQKLLVPLNWAMFGICLWNMAMCLILLRTI